MTSNVLNQHFKEDDERFERFVEKKIHSKKIKLKSTKDKKK